MREHLDSLEKQAFVSPTREQIDESEKRLKAIREVSADYRAALEGTLPTKGGCDMTEKPSVTLPGKVDKVISGHGEPEKAEISVEGAHPLYQEIRIENSLKDAKGNEVHLKQNEEVQVTIEAEKDASQAPQDQEKAPRARRAS
jgi:hypothetical protein